MSEIKTVLNFFDKNNGLDGVIKDLKEVKKLQAEINKQKGSIGSDNLKERTAALKKITQLQKQLDAQRKKSVKTGKAAVGVEKQLVAVQEKDRQVKAKLKVARSEKFRQLQESNLALQKQNKLVKDEIKENSKLSSVYDRQSAKLNRLRKELKNLILTEGAGSTKTKKLALEVGKLDTKLKAADASAGQFQRNVGNYPKGLKGAIGALKNFAGALGITAGIAGLARALGNAITIAKDFEQGNANLAAVLGKTKDEIGTLTQDAKRLGAATAFSATQVSGLQVEFAKLGFNEQEILNATEATLSLAAATGSDLGEAAAIAGATLGGFGLGAEETQRVVDVMAKSFSTSALDIEKFKESMKNAAPAAKAVGISVEETTALLGTLANAGISGSKAGNNLKTSFINLNKAGLTLEEGLEKVAKSEDKLGTAAKLVGKNAAASFLVLSEGVDVTKELTKGLNNAGGAAEKMAKEQLNTLQGSLTILNSAWEGFVLGLLSGDSAFSSISRSIVETTTSLLGMLTPSAELADTWFSQRDAVNELESGLNPLLNRYDELTTKTELTKDEQEELDTIIQQVAKTVPTAITEFDKYGKALDISTSAAKKFIQQQKDLLALDNAKAIEEQEDAIVDLNDSLEGLNNTYIMRNGVLQTYSKELKQFLPADAQEISDFTKKGEAIRNEIILREAKIAKLRGEKTELEKLAESQEVETDLIDENTEAIEKNIEAKQKKRKTDAQIQKEREERLQVGYDRDKKRQEDDQNRLDKALERQQERLKLEQALANSDLHEKERLRKEQEEADKIAAKKKEESDKKKKEQKKQVIDESKEAVDAVIDNLQMESQARIDSLDRQINAEQNFLDSNENLSAREIEFRRKKQAELEAERIEEQARLEKLAKTQAFFDLVAAFASSGDGQGAVGKAATTMAAAEVISGGFHDGGYTGDGNEHKQAGVVHKGEFVNTKKQTSEYGMKGWTAKDFDSAVSDGYFNQFTDSNMFADQNAKFLSVQNNKVGYDFAKLESRLDSVVDAVGNIQSSDFAIQDGYFIKTKRSKGNTLVTKKKLG